MRTNVRLLRAEENYRFGTFGLWLIDARAFCVTLEPADLENRSFVSSIPAQQYMCERYSSEKYPDTFQIINVPDRDLCLLHPGNIVKHTEGCVLLAQHFGKLNIGGVEERAVLNSGRTFRTFMNLMHGIDSFHLTIKEHY